jgi:membrane fusion protein (multidrug efflux system)
VARGPQGDTVKVVTSDGALSTREVKLGGAQGSAWVVLSGLKAGEQVMVEGFQKIGGKSVVKPVPWPAAPSAPGSGAAGAAPAASTASASASSGSASAASKS